VITAQYVVGLMDKAIAKVNQIQNELYRYENVFQHSVFLLHHCVKFEI
jgi:hypothetical protein